MAELLQSLRRGMESLFTKKVPFYFRSEKVQLIKGDCFLILKKIKPESIDMIFADPPYFLSNGGISVHSGKAVCVDKGDWGWSFQKK